MATETKHDIRRPSRKKTKTGSVTDAEHMENTPVLKRTRRPQKTGRLAELMNMPMDILFEIFGHLRPLDVLNLSRTTKEFRRILMHRSSISVWKAARANIPDFPDCPPEMSEPQWAHLAFYPGCNICFTPGIRNVDWRLRIRLCSKCSKEHIRETSFGWFNLTDQRGLSFRSLVPYRPGKRNRIAYFVDDYRAIEAQYEAIESLDLRRAFLEERRKTLAGMAEHASLCETWASAQAQGRSQELQELKSSRKKDIIGKLTALGWGDEIDKIPYYDDLGNHRLVKVPQQLTGRIWNNIRKPLTGYMEQMKAKRLARELGTQILARKRVAINILRNYKKSRLPFTSVMPEPYDFCLFPAIKTVIEQPADVHVDESSFANIVPLLPSIINEWRRNINKQLVKKLRQQESERERSLRYTFPFLSEQEDEWNECDNLASDEVVEEKMKLATTVFRCGKCFTDTSNDYDDYFSFDDLYSDSELELEFDYLFGGQDYPTKPIDPLFYPNVLGHRCLTKQSGWSYPNMSDDPTMILDMIPSYRQKWSCESLELDKATGRIVESLVEASGLDPTTATARDMDQLNAMFVCLLCTDPDLEPESPRVPVFGWRAAMTHSAKHPASYVWHKLTLNKGGTELGLGLAWPEEWVSEDAWLCMHCHDLPTEPQPMQLASTKTHLALSHDILEPILDHDYARDFASPGFHENASPFKTFHVDPLVFLELFHDSLLPAASHC